MPTQNISNAQIEIKTKCQFIPDESRPEENYYFFKYQIEISNKGSIAAQLMNRHWIITDANGKVDEVRGAGVIGHQPQLGPGSSFEYESACPLSTSSGSMRGFYQFVDDSGISFDVAIPEFYLLAPGALH